MLPARYSRGPFRDGALHSGTFNGSAARFGLAFYLFAQLLHRTAVSCFALAQPSCIALWFASVLGSTSLARPKPKHLFFRTSAAQP